MTKFLLFIIICFCSVNAFGKIEVIEPSAIADVDDWDSTGGPDKPTLLTSGSETTYIIGDATNETDKYDCGDLTETDIDEVDSVVVHYKAREQSNGNNKVQAGIFVGSDVTNGTENALSTTWTDYRDPFTTPPGSRSTWDDFEVDSLVVRFVATTVGSACWVTICSVQVFYKSLNRTIMTPEKDDACLSGNNFDHDLRRKSAMQNDTAFVFVAGDGAGANDYWKSGDNASAYHKMNNDDWETGGFGVFLDVVLVKADCSLDVRISRYNSSCVVQESTPFFPAIGTAKFLIDTTGHYEFQIPQHDWTAGACGDELAVQFRWTNVEGQADDSVWILYGSADTYFEHEININVGCGAEAGAGDCADTVGAVPNQEGGIAQFVNVGGADLITSISDAVDANYMKETTQNEQQEVQFVAISDPGDLSTYDSVSIVFRATRAGTSGGRIRIRMTLQDSTNVGQFCQNTYTKYVMAAGTWVDFTDELTVFGAPSGSVTCEGAFTAAEINTWEVKFTAVQLSAGREAWITSVDLVVCYTTTGGDQNYRRIRMQKMGKLDDKTVWDEYFEQELAQKEYETSMTFGVPPPPSVWLWGRQ